MKSSAYKAMLNGGICLSVLVAGSAFAQTAADTAGDRLAVEDIVVTAQRRVERLQDTPIAVTALDNSALEERGLTNMQEALSGIPSLTFSTGDPTGGSTSANIYIRGIGQNDFIITTDPGVGVYIDGVFYPRTTGGLLDLSDIARVEILRGPQGTLYGRNTIGGAINITTVEPDTSEVSGMVEVAFGRFDHVSLRSSINLPISNNFAVRASGAYKRADGFVDRVIAGDKLGGYDSLVGRLRGLWEASDRLTVDFAVDATRTRNDSSPTYITEFVQTGNLAPLYLAPFVMPVIERPSSAAGSAAVDDYIARYGRLPVLENKDNRYVSHSTGPNVSNLDSWGTSMTLRYDLTEELKLSTISGYREMVARFGFDATNSPYQYTQSLNDVDSKSFTQEIQISGSVFEDKLNFVTGLYYFYEKATDSNQVRLASGLYDSLESLPAAVVPLDPAIVCPAPFPAPCLGGAGNPFNTAFDLDFHDFNRMITNSYAAFGQATFNLNDSLSVVGGLRYTRDEKEYYLAHQRINSGVYKVAPTTTDRADSSLSPKVGINYKIDNRKLLYVSASRGFKSGGFNGRPTTLAEVSAFGPERVWTYEMGLKSDLFDRRLRLNTAMFWNDYTDIQINQFSADTSGNLVLLVENAGKARMRGLELEYTFVATENLTIDGALSYIDAEYTHLNPGVSVGINNKLPQTPTWTAKTGFIYNVGLSDNWSLGLRGDWRYRSAVYNNAENTASLKAPGLHLFDARVMFTEDDAGLELAAYVKNLTNRQYITGGLQVLASFGQAAATMGRPREWGVLIKKTF